MLDFYQQLAQALAQEPVVLATVTQVKGSVPREVGAKLFIRADGTIFGTIGGGAGEAKVCQQALQVLKTGEKQWATIDLTGVPQRETQGVCGGTMQVWLELWSGETAIALVQAIVNLLINGHSATLVTPFAAQLSPYLAIEPQNRINSAFIIQHSSFTERISPPPTLLIIGAGHIAVPLAQIAQIAGFRVVVQDERTEFASLVRFPSAAAIFAQPLAAALNQLTGMTDLYVVLVTRSYKQDLTALRLLLPRQVQYIGAIGSEKRIRLVYQLLQQEEYSWRSLSKIHAPIGLDLGALSPEEIAVSICAELIKVRRGGTGKSLSEIFRAFENSSKT